MHDKYRHKLENDADHACMQLYMSTACTYREHIQIMHDYALAKIISVNGCVNVSDNKN